MADNDTNVKTTGNRYFTANEMNKLYGIPITMIRREIKEGIVPGFYSGTWFHIDGPAYLEMLSKRNIGG